jgi:hypothetical protein
MGCEGMKIAMKSLTRDEKGQTLILALILLIVGGLIIAPLLAYMNTGLLAGGVYERKTAELYAADAGVEDAVLKIQYQVPKVQGLFCGSSNHTYPYNIADVNGKSVAVTITWVNNVTDGATYQIISRATADSSGTTIKSYVDAEFAVMNLFDNAITSQGNIDLGSNSIVNGSVQYGGSLSGGGTVNGTQTPEAYANWPNCTALSSYYLGQVNTTNPGPNNINVDGMTVTLEPSYINGDLSVDGKNNGVLKPTGTVYVNGSVTFNQSGNNGYTLNLSGQTIFATGSISFPSNHVSVAGSGCIIACGDVKFQPGMSSSPNDFVFVMSVSGKVTFSPSGTFYGSLAGDVKVDLQPNCKMNWTSWQGRGINFPIEQYSYNPGVVQTVTIRTWEVSPL